MVEWSLNKKFEKNTMKNESIVSAYRREKWTWIVLEELMCLVWLFWVEVLIKTWKEINPWDEVVKVSAKRHY